MQTSVCCEKTTDNNVSERMALGIVKTLCTTFCILAAFMSLSFTSSQEKTTLSLVGVILSMKVFGDEMSRGSSCLVRFLLILTKKSSKYSALARLWLVTPHWDSYWTNVLGLVRSQDLICESPKFARAGCFLK